MGLDSVELLMELEDTFDIEISNLEAEKVKTVEDSVETFYPKIALEIRKDCLAQAVFYQVRKAFVGLGKNKKIISPATKLTDLINASNITQEWSGLSDQLHLQLPKLVKLDIDKSKDREIKFFGQKIYERPRPITDRDVRKLIDWIVSLNYNKLIDTKRISSRYEVERIVMGVTCEKMGIPINQIELSSSFNYDLGIS